MITQQITRNILKQVTAVRSAAGGGSSVDPAASAYFAAVEDAGGSFDLTTLDGYDSDFSAGTDGWGATAGLTIQGNVDDVLGRNDCMQITKDGDSRCRVSPFNRTVFLYATEEYSISCEVFIPDDNQVVEQVRLSSIGVGATSIFSVTTKGQWVTVSNENYTPPIDTGMDLTLNTSTGNDNPVSFESAYIRNFQIRNTANATYTDTYVKNAHDVLFKGLKADGLWDKITDFYLLLGKTFDGITVKAKGTGALTNNNFVSGDYVAAGSGGGLVGNGSSKYIATGFNDSSISASSKSFSVYQTSSSITDFRSMISSYTSDGTVRLQISTSSPSTNTRFIHGAIGSSLISGTGSTGLLIANRRGDDDCEAYINGTSAGTDTLSASPGSAGEFHLFADYLDAGQILNYSEANLTFAHIGLGLTDTDAANLSTRVNDFMTALDANVYGPPRNAEPEALDYFSAVEDAGGSFDLTGINATYTETYVKNAHDILFKGLKADELWDKLTELYLLIGKTFDGITVKAKGTGALTNNNFVSGDYVAAGGGGGMTDGSGKYLDSGFAASSFNMATTGGGIAIYLAAHSETTNGRMMGRYLSPTEQVRFFGSSGNAIVANPGNLSSAGLGFFDLSFKDGDQALYKNGTSVATATTNPTMPAGNLHLLGINGLSGDTTDRQCLSVIHEHLTPTESANLYTRVQAFMTALGAEV